MYADWHVYTAWEVSVSPDGAALCADQAVRPKRRLQVTFHRGRKSVSTSSHDLRSLLPTVRQYPFLFPKDTGAWAKSPSGTHLILLMPNLPNFHVALFSFSTSQSGLRLFPVLCTKSIGLQGKFIVVGLLCCEENLSKGVFPVFRVYPFCENFWLYLCNGISQAPDDQQTILEEAWLAPQSNFSEL